MRRAELQSLVAFEFEDENDDISTENPAEGCSEASSRLALKEMHLEQLTWEENTNMWTTNSIRHGFF
jgi:hypothetical protein